MKMQNENLNIPNVTVNQVVEMLSLLYSSAITSGTSFRGIPTPFLWGPAGIGKSEAIEQLAEELAEKTKKTVSITDVRLLLFSPVDLRGVPVADAEKQFSQWLMPKIFDMNPDNSHLNLLFLDELSAAPQSVQAAAYQICLDRKIGEHKLPDNCIVIGAGNRTTDQSVSYKMPKALCNRLMHFSVNTNYKEWSEWAKFHNIDKRVIEYLAFDESKLCVEPESSDMAYPTPRSWSFVSGIMKTTSQDVEKIHPLISACVGVDTALEFEAWLKVHEEMPKVEDVLQGLPAPYPQTYDVLDAFSESIVSAVCSREEWITIEELENVCQYIGKLPVAFTASIYSELNKNKAIQLKLTKCHASQEWVRKNKDFIRGEK